MTDRELARLALEARNRAYVPYSHFSVGAALLGRSGKVYCGCNIENASYGATNCAERTAFFSAISQGEHEFDAIAICGGKEGSAPEGFCPPCGICRQVMLEFCSPRDFRIVLAKSESETKSCRLEELIPFSFDPAYLR